LIYLTCIIVSGGGTPADYFLFPSLREEWLYKETGKTREASNSSRYKYLQKSVIILKTADKNSRSNAFISGLQLFFSGDIMSKVWMTKAGYVE